MPAWVARFHPAYWPRLIMKGLLRHNGLRAVAIRDPSPEKTEESVDIRNVFT